MPHNPNWGKLRLCFWGAALAVGCSRTNVPTVSRLRPEITLPEGNCPPGPGQLVFASRLNALGAFIPSKLLSSLVIPFGG